jgi:hypothetical protein
MITFPGLVHCENELLVELVAVALLLPYQNPCCGVPWVSWCPPCERYIRPNWPFDAWQHSTFCLPWQRLRNLVKEDSSNHNNNGDYSSIVWGLWMRWNLKHAKMSSTCNGTMYEIWGDSFWHWAQGRRLPNLPTLKHYKHVKCTWHNTILVICIVWPWHSSGVPTHPLLWMFAEPWQDGSLMNWIVLTWPMIDVNKPSLQNMIRAEHYDSCLN